MVDVPLMRAARVLFPDGAVLLPAADVDQLPSVGPEQVLADVLGSGRAGCALDRDQHRRGSTS
jgi:exodeoxyribonuclease V alpha subunit